MKRDIRELFKDNEAQTALPKNHRAEFLEKLQQQPKPATNYKHWLRIAVVAVIALGIGFGVLYKSPIENQNTMVAQIQAIEAQYLQDIDTEWHNFVALTKDDVLVARYKKRLDALDADYQDISAQFQNDTNNILVIEALVENLQTRLQLLKDIQEHINILNQNNEQYETSI